jgi:hypothetical protein
MMPRFQNLRGIEEAYDMEMKIMKICKRYRENYREGLENVPLDTA